MVSAIIVAAVVGVGLGVFLQKGRFCFVNAFRDLVAFKDNRVTKGVLAATLLTMVFWSTAYELGMYQGFWTPGWGLTGVVGGFIFGVGMTYAGGCATGTLFRAGEGYLQFWLTLLFMGVGYLGFTLAFPTLKSAYFQPLTFGEGFTLFSLGVPAPLLAVAFAAVGVLLYSQLVGSGKRREGAVKPSAETAQYVLADLPSDLAVGLRSFVSGTRGYFRGFLRIDDPVEALRRPWDPRTAALGITALAVVWFTQVSIVGIRVRKPGGPATSSSRRASTRERTSTGARSCSRARASGSRSTW